MRRELFLCLVHGFLQCLVGIFEPCHFCLDGFSLFFLALFHQRADLCGQFLAFRQIDIQLGLCLPAFLVGGQHVVNSFFGSGEMFFLQTFDDPFGPFVDEF